MKQPHPGHPGSWDKRDPVVTSVFRASHSAHRAQARYGTRLTIEEVWHLSNLVKQGKAIPIEAKHPGHPRAYMGYYKETWFAFAWNKEVYTILPSYVLPSTHWSKEPNVKQHATPIGNTVVFRPHPTAAQDWKTGKPPFLARRLAGVVARPKGCQPTPDGKGWHLDNERHWTLEQDPADETQFILTYDREALTLMVHVAGLIEHLMCPEGADKESPK
jgi:hypothetical protein